MSPLPTSYRFRDSAEARRALQRAAERFPHRRGRGATRCRTYYDTFDWRVFRAGAALWTSDNGRALVLHWARADATPSQRASLTSEPGFVRDLPPGPLQDELASIVEMRRLLPVVEVKAPGETLDMLDQREKTVARLRLETLRARAAPTSSEPVSLPLVLHALPVRGYDRQFHALLRVLETELAPQRLEWSEYEHAAAAVGLQPGDYSSKLDIALTPDMRSDEAVKVIHKRLLEVVRRNEDGLRRDIDSEFLHDFRVAVRRTRAALGQIKGVYPPEIVARFKTEFSWLGKVTGPTRDLHVYQLKMPEYRSSLPEHVRSDLDPLGEFVDRNLEIEHRALVQALDSERYRSLLRDWQEYLEQPVAKETTLPEACSPVLDLASRQIAISYRRVMKKGGAIAPDSPAEALHRLRIECKKLRYLLEFFRSLFDPTDLALLIRTLKRLQDNLGDFNDLEVQQHTLQQFAQTMVAERLGRVETLMVMGRLVERLEQRQIAERQDFHRRFSKFASRKNRKRFERLLGPLETGEA